MQKLLNYVQECNMNVNENLNMTLTGSTMLIIALFLTPRISYLFLLDLVFEQAFLPLSSEFFQKLDLNTVLTFVLFLIMISLVPYSFKTAIKNKLFRLGICGEPALDFDLVLKVWFY